MDRDEFNPYAAPVAAFGPAPTDVADASGAEAIRRAHIKHEASVKAIGLLNYFGAFILISASIFLILMAVGAVPAPNARAGQGPAVFTPMVGLLGGLALAFGLLAVAIGRGLRHLQPWARWTEVVMMGLQTAGNLYRLNPIGLVISIYILWLLASSKGATVFSPGYKEVIALTPHIKYQTSLLVKIFAGILIAVLGLAVIGGIVAALSARR